MIKSQHNKVVSIADLLSSNVSNILLEVKFLRAKFCYCIIFYVPLINIKIVVENSSYIILNPLCLAIWGGKTVHIDVARIKLFKCEQD